MVTVGKGPCVSVHGRACGLRDPAGGSHNLLITLVCAGARSPRVLVLRLLPQGRCVNTRLPRCCSRVWSGISEENTTRHPPCTDVTMPTLTPGVDCVSAQPPTLPQVRAFPGLGLRQGPCSSTPSALRATRDQGLAWLCGTSAGVLCPQRERLLYIYLAFRLTGCVPRALVIGSGSPWALTGPKPELSENQKVQSSPSEPRWAGRWLALPAPPLHESEYLEGICLLWGLSRLRVPALQTF